MENKKEKSSGKVKNTTKWKIFVAIFLIALGILAVIGISNSIGETTPVSGEQTTPTMQTNIQNNGNIQESETIENLEQTENKTEEELQKINKEEIEKAEKEEKKKQTGNKTNNTTTKPKNKYYIKVNYGAQVVNVYTYDKNGKYTVPVKAFVCSTGTATPKSGVYKIPAKITWCHMYGGVWGHYCSQIVGNILFHSVPYLERNNHTLEYWAYDQLGTKASMGCIRLTTRDAKWIYDNVRVGTSVEFYSSSNPGPLGKPSAQKISKAPGNLKWWDPTDPDSQNPWKTYKPSTNTNKKPNNNTQTNQQNTNQTGNNQVQNTTNSQANNMQTNQVENNTIENQTQNNVIDNSQTNNHQEENNNTIENSIEENNEMVNEQI